MTIRPAHESDVDALLALIREENDKLLERERSEIEALLPTFFVYEAEDGSIAGCACLEVYSQKIAELRSVAVRKDHRGKGIGKGLVDTALQLAKERNIKEVLVVTSDLSFFQRMNFDICLNEKYALFWKG